jgi:hypothetical protein
MEVITQKQYGQNGQHWQNNAPVSKQGKRISKDDLISYIKTNKDVLKNVKYVDLNEIQEKEKPTFLEKTQFQNLVEIDYFSPNLTQIFKLNSSNNRKYLHAGCLRTINTKTKTFQVSFFSSIISCLKPSFFSSPVSYQISFMNQFIERLKEESTGIKFNEFGYKKKYGWKVNDLKEYINDNQFGPNIYKYVSDYFHINIFILDLEKDLLFFGGDEYIPFKYNIFLLKYIDTTYEPIFVGGQRTFTAESDIVKELIRNNPDNVNVYHMANKMSLGFEESEEDLAIYKPKKDIVKSKEDWIKDKIEKDKNKPEGIYDKKQQEKKAKERKTSEEVVKPNIKFDLMTSVKSTKIIKQTKTKKKSDNPVSYLSESKNEEYDEDMNAFEECSEEELINSDKSSIKPVKKIKQLSDVSEQYNSDSDNTSKSSEFVKPTKTLKQVLKKVNKTTKKESSKYKVSDIKDSLKVNELKDIAKEIGIQIGKKTKAVLITEIKKVLTEKKN